MSKTAGTIQVWRRKRDWLVEWKYGDNWRRPIRCKSKQEVKSTIRRLTTERLPLGAVNVSFFAEEGCTVDTEGWDDAKIADRKNQEG